MELKVGQQFEVVEVLTSGSYINVFKTGGWTIGERGIMTTRCLSNGSNDYKGRGYTMWSHSEVKSVGRLTVTAIHDCESKIK